MKEPLTLKEAAPLPRQRTEQLIDAAVRCAEERRWDVLPGTWLETVGGREVCSCGDADCARPGAHATTPDWAGLATGSGPAVRRIWTGRPTSSVLLPTGRSFDALDVTESAGFLALARMERLELAVGPVIRTPDRRTLFLVLPGGAAKLPELVGNLGWDAAAIGLAGRGEGDYVAAPPTRVGGRGAVQWVRRPAPADHRLPGAAELVGPLAYACARETADARGRLS